MIRNPIVNKELVHVLRSRTAFALALVSVGALSALALFMWPESGINPVGALHSRLFLAVVLCGQLVMLALFTPPFSATSITYERESNTWEMLYFSLLRPDQVLYGKLVGAVAFLLLLVGFSLPVGATCFLLGGVSLSEMLRCYLVLAMAGVTFGLVGLTCSSLFPSSFSSLIATYLALLLLCGGVHVPMLLLPEWREGHALMHAVRCMSPFTALVAIAKDQFRSMGPRASWGAVVRYFVFSGIFCAAMVTVLIARIAMRPAPKIAKRKGVVDKRTPLGARVLRRIFFVIDPRRRRRSIGLLMNPVFILDLRTRTAGVSNDSLRMTPLRPWTIFLGKFAAAVLLSLMLVVASVPVFFAILYIQEAFEASYLIAMFSITCVTIVFTLSAGLFFSSMCRTTARAAAWAYGVVALVTVGSLLGLVLRDRMSDAMAKAILAFNPIVTVVGAVSFEQFAEYGRWQNNVTALGVLSLLLFAATVLRLHRVAGPTE